MAPVDPFALHLERRCDADAVGIAGGLEATDLALARPQVERPGILYRGNPRLLGLGVAFRKGSLPAVLQRVDFTGIVGKARAGDRYHGIHFCRIAGRDCVFDHRAGGFGKLGTGGHSQASDQKGYQDMTQVLHGARA